MNTFDLPVLEAILLLLLVAVHTAAGTLATLQLARRHRRHESLLVSCILVAVVLDAALLGLRGMSIKAVPLTGLFDSLIVLAFIFGVLYLWVKPAVEQVWFGSLLVWVILGVVLTAALVARPASQPQDVARTPWAVAHAGFMILAAASIVFAAANSALYLLSSYRLKHRGVMQVLGRIPNMEALARMNRLGVRIGLILLTVGIASGLRLSSLDIGIARWLADSKVICIIIAWCLLGATVVLDRLGLLRIKVRAYVTLAAFGLIIVAIIGVTIAGATRHSFSRADSPATRMVVT